MRKYDFVFAERKTGVIDRKIESRYNIEGTSAEDKGSRKSPCGSAEKWKLLLEQQQRSLNMELPSNPKIRMKLVSALDKVFVDTEPVERPEDAMLSVFRNEVGSFQAAYTLTRAPRGFVELEIVSPIKQWVRVRSVKHMPVRFATYYDNVNNYLRTGPGLYPDLLSDVQPHLVRGYWRQWDTLWIDIEPDANTPAGVHEIEIRMSWKGELQTLRTIKVEILDAYLPEQKLIHTKWFHSDCLADYYRVDVFSEEYWRITENFMANAVRGGINMILMPVHTPPLDTREGGERTTVQLVDVTLENGEYKFGFDNLRRWVELCRKVGVKYYEIAHLYTQWGAKYAPKIMATVDGEYKRIFGWDTEATSEAYRTFLRAYIPALIEEFKALGIDKQCYFHISDEPEEAHLPFYLAAKEQIKDLLEGYPIMDALSSFELYQDGVVEKPIPTNDHIEPFLKADIKGLWTYYCCMQYKEVSNTFFSMPSARTRILGVQLYKYNIEGFLHWGFNYYNSQYSDYHTNPYLHTDGDAFSPAGDCFQVYPRTDGMPEDSIRKMVTTHAMYDLRAFEMLEQLAGREKVMELIEGDLKDEITFASYPTSETYLLNLRSRVNREIMKYIKG